MTWQAAVHRYTTEVMPQAVKPGTAKRYKVSFRTVDPWLRGKTLDQIDRKTLGDMVAERQKALVANATINRDLTAVSQVLACGIEWHACEQNAAAQFNRRLLTRERRDPIHLPADEAIAAVIERAPGNFAALIRFCELTGGRQEESAALLWPNVRLEAAEATFMRTKTTPARTIKLSDAAVALLRSVPRRLKCDFVFWHGAGQRYLNVSSRFAQLCDAAGQDFRFHDLRHLYAVRYLREHGGAAIYDLQQQLGHASIKTTELYLAYVAAETGITKSSEKSHHPSKVAAVSGETVATEEGEK